jgi:hypothetical protein
VNNKLYQDSYFIINFIFAGVIVLIVLYSGIFSAQKQNHPIPSFCPHQPCASTGLSRSFSEIVRFRFESANSFNKNGIRIFLFFFVQFWLRIFFSIINAKFNRNRTKIIIFDSVISVFLFFFSFKNFIFYFF